MSFSLRETRGSGFTLIELLVVIAIISILATILLPTLSQAKNLAMGLACGNNQRSIGHTLAFFVEDHDQKFPYVAYSTSVYWKFMLYPYLDLQRQPNGWGNPYDMKGTVFDCPANTEEVRVQNEYKVYYDAVIGFNRQRTVSDVTRNPSDVVWLADGRYVLGFSDCCFYEGRFPIDIGDIHDNHPNVLFLDSHVELSTFVEPKDFKIN